MAEKLLLVEREDNICTLVLNCPERRNALSPELLLQLGDAVNSLQNDPQIRVVIIRGAGEQAFSGGFDIGKIPTEGLAKEGLRANPLEYGMESICSFPYPVIAMIYGYAVGAGLELAVSCDLRIAADTARLGITPVKLGVVYAHTGIQKFINLVGVARTKELFFTGRLIDAQKAKDIGLVDHVVPAQDLPSAAYGIAREIAENAPIAVSGTKITILKLLSYQKLSPEEEKELEALREQAILSEDAKEGQEAFLEKRKPVFKGK
jgi:enoyl-CoA hydratase/carnithine racemase